jgi:hypothetical protein
MKLSRVFVPLSVKTVKYICSIFVGVRHFSFVNNELKNSDYASLVICRGIKFIKVCYIEAVYAMKMPVKHFLTVDLDQINKHRLFEVNDTFDASVNDVYLKRFTIVCIL